MILWYCMVSQLIECFVGVVMYLNYLNSIHNDFSFHTEARFKFNSPEYNFLMLASNYHKPVQFQPEFEDLIEFFTSEALKEQPKDLIDFGVEFFDSLERVSRAL